MATNVIVQIRPEAARELGERRTETPGAKEVAEAASALGVSLEQMHPGVEDESLAQYFTVEVPEHDAVKAVVERLMKCEAVEAAYVKPSEGMP
jgi:hypothetical protein